MTRKIYRIHHFTPETRTIAEKALENFARENLDYKNGEITSARFRRFACSTGLYLHIESSSGSWGVSPIMTDIGEISGLLKKMDARTPQGLKGKGVTVYFSKKKDLAVGFSVRQ
ncbi:MAG: hypothetical protein AABW93_03245 [Nanoarchaeota archaeon]